MLQGKGSFTRNMAVVAGGLAVGALGGRLLPPLLAGATGSVRTRLGADPFERLKQDHRQILTLLARMRSAPDDALARRGALFLSLKRTLGKHALAEEDVVYPILHEEAGAAEAARRLYREHAEIKVHLYAIETALKNQASWAGRVEALSALVERHIRDEEDVEFPRLQAFADARRSSTLAGQIHREEAMML